MHTKSFKEIPPALILAKLAIMLHVRAEWIRLERVEDKFVRGSIWRTKPGEINRFEFTLAQYLGYEPDHSEAFALSADEIHAANGGGSPLLSALLLCLIFTLLIAAIWYAGN